MAPATSGPQIFEDANRGPVRSSVFRNLMSSKPHKRNQSADDAMASQIPKNKPPTSNPFPWTEGPAPAPGHLPLGEIVPNHDSRDNNVTAGKDDKGTMHKKTKSAVSLKSLRSYMERKDSKSEDAEELSPKKTKSSNSLSAILKRSQRGRKGEGSKQSRDKENRSPTDLVDNMPSPAWSDTTSIYPEPMARSRPNSRPTSTADRCRSVADEVSLYTPRGYSPAQQRNFYDYHQPSLTRTGESKPRPKSDCMAGNKKVKNILGSIPGAQSGERNAGDRRDSAASNQRGVERARKLSAPESPASTVSKEQAAPRRLSRVQAAISAFNAKEKDSDVHKHLNSKDLESEFEKLLVCVIVSESYIIPSNLCLGRAEHPPQHER